jgi:SHS2 domain-containing protein
VESAARGHRCRPHTADLVVEAWGASRDECLDEAVRALVETFTAVRSVSAPEPVPVRFDGGDDLDLLVRVLEEVIYVLDVRGKVAIGVSLEDADDGGVAGFFETVPVEDVEVIGAVPKGVSRSGLAFAEDDDGRWRCHALVDV